MQPLPAPSCTCTTSGMTIQLKLEGKATLGLIVSRSYYAAYLWRSHYKIHKLFKHVPTVLALSFQQLVQHSFPKSPLPLCTIDRIKQLSLIRKQNLPAEARFTTIKRKKLMCNMSDITVGCQFYLIKTFGAVAFKVQGTVCLLDNCYY
ncbi:hypothetical protein ILYODFUR_018986 [Ilyodon furcidens]|uniref:Uncharacterized protein n=1 Tax=Ilyodon furcidens TaxID=33524 RepID=A0ABV0T9G5_9TELE